MDPGFWWAAEALLGTEQVVRLRRMDQGFVPLCVGTDTAEVVVLGTAGDPYLLGLADDGRLACSCPDARRNRPPVLCKHLAWFVVRMGGGGVAALQGTEPELGTAVVAAMEALRDRVRRDTVKYRAVPGALREQDECCICQDPLGPAPGCVRCPTCGNHFHTPCIMEWQRRSTACPICRGLSWGDLACHVRARLDPDQFPGPL